MSTDGPFIECYPAIALRSYHDAKRGITCVYEGLILIGMAAIDLFMVIFFLIALGYAYLVALPLHLFHWMKPNHPDAGSEHHQRAE